MMSLRKKWFFGMWVITALILLAVVATFFIRTIDPSNNMDTPSAATEDPHAPLQVERVGGQVLNSAEGFSVSVTRAEMYTANNAPAALGNPPRGTRWALITASLYNETGRDALTVQREDLVLMTSHGKALLPQPGVERIKPYLVGYTLPIGNSVYGFVVYAVPTTEAITALQWCPTSNCTERLNAPIPLIIED